MNLRRLLALACVPSILVIAHAAPPETGKLARHGKNTVVKTIEVDKRERTYLLHVPPGLPRDRAVPLVFVFHGGGGKAAGMELSLTHFSSLADREKFLVVYPEGIDRHWNDGRDNPSSGAAKDNVDDVAFIVAILEAVGKDHKIDRKRVYATGISNGGIFSHYLAARQADRIAAIAPVVGGIATPFNEKFKPSQPVSVLILQGTKDPLVPYGGGKIRPGERGGVIATDDAVRLWVQNNGCESKPVVEDLPNRVADDGCTVQRFSYGKGKNGSEVALVKIEGGGHTWPGGPQYLPAKLIGNVCKDIDGTEMIWEFFKKHPKP